MARIEKVLPSVFGQPREARVTTRHPDMPNPYEGLSRDLKRFGADMSHVFDGLVRLGEEGQQLALEQARADYEQEVADRFDREVFSLNGESAAGVGRKAEEILKSAEDRQLEKLSAYGARPGQMFRIFAARSGATHLSRAVHHGRAEVRRATIDAGNRVMAQSMKVFAATGSSGSLAEINTAYARAYEAANGRVIDPAKLAAFDKNMQEGFVSLNGEKLRIVDRIAPGDKGVIARATAEDLRARLVREQETYEQGRQAQIDRAHAERIDQLLKWGMLSEAEAHLAAASAGGDPALQMSEPVREVCAAQLRVHQELRAAETGAQAEVQQIVAQGAQDPRTLGGKYWTTTLEKQVSETRLRLAEEARNAADERQRALAKKKLALFETSIRTERAARIAAEKADIEQLRVEFAQAGLLDRARLGDLGSRIAAMPESPVKDFFVKVYANNRRAVEEETSRDPEVRKSRTAVVLEIKRLAAAGEPAQIDGHEYDLSTKEGLATVMMKAGLTPKETASVKAYLANRRIRVDAAAQAAADALNQANGFTPDPDKGKLYFTQQAVLRLCPEVLDRLEAEAKMFPEIKMDTKEGRLWMRERILQYLYSMQASRPGWLYGTDPVLLHKFLAAGIDKEGNVIDGEMSFSRFCENGFTPEQIRKQAQYEEDVRALAVKRSSATLGVDQAESNARRKGVVRGEINGEPAWFTPSGKRKADAEAAKKEQSRRAAEQSAEGLVESMTGFRLSAVQDAFERGAL